MAKPKRLQQEIHPGTNALPSTITIRPSDAFWPEAQKIASVLGISLGEFGKLACEAAVRMIRAEDPKVPNFVDKARVLIDAGFVDRHEREFGHASSLETATLRDLRSVSVSLFDRIPCGLPRPSWAEQAIGEVTVPTGKYPERIFALLASGDSLNMAKLPSGKVGIQDGDVLICQCTDDHPPQLGDLVVACIDGEFTCKRYTKDGLLPESTNRKNKAPHIPEAGAKAVAVVLDSAKLPVRKYAL